MDIRVELATSLTDWRNWEDEEILEVLDAHYYTLATTGEQAVLAVLDDIIHDRFHDAHLMEDERMGRILIKFARTLKDSMDTPAVDFYLARKSAQESDNG